MSKRKTYQLLFFIKRKKLLKSGKAKVFLRISINNQSKELALACEVDPEIWNSEKAGASGNTKEAKQVNQFIHATKFKIQDIVNEIELEKDGFEPELIRNKYLGIEPKTKTILEVFTNHNKRIEMQIGKGYAFGTYKRYKVTFNHIQAFIIWKYKTNDLPVTSINAEFITDLEVYLKSEKNCQQNTTNKYLNNFKKIVNIAVENDWLLKNPFANRKFKWEKTEREFLSEPELERMINKKFDIHRLEAVKDCFLFACFTGLAHSDLAKLSPENIIIGIDNKKWISINRQKTNQSSRVPLLPYALKIIDKYKDHPEVVNRGKLLPVLSNQKMNAYLKEIADICMIRKTLTSHIARHTFATTVTLNNDVPIESVSKMLGHKSLEMTKIYAKLLDKKVSRDMEPLSRKFS